MIYGFSTIFPNIWLFSMSQRVGCGCTRLYLSGKYAQQGNPPKQVQSHASRYSLQNSLQFFLEQHAMHLEEVCTLLDKFMREAEDRWIEREALRNLVETSNIPLSGPIEELYRQARESPEYRDKAREVFAEWRNILDKASKAAFVEALLDDESLPKGEPN
jgi:hypothetical protein